MITNFYNPNFHVGYLPVRVLQLNILKDFQEVAPDFINAILLEQRENGLQKAIVINNEKTSIKESKMIAGLTPSHQIVLGENFIQFIWNLAYSLITLLDEGIIKPQHNNEFRGYLDLSNPLIKQAVEVFNNGLLLLNEYNDVIYFKQPNPERYDPDSDDYVCKVNGAFISALVFILAHEFAHQYYGHLPSSATNDDQKKQQEYDCDDYAYCKMEHQFNTTKGKTIKIGIVIALCSIIFMNKTMKGGNEHPDNDDRLKRQISKMALNETDNLWGIASLALMMWMNYYHIGGTIPSELEHGKEWFDILMDKVASTKLQ